LHFVINLPGAVLASKNEVHAIKGKDYEIAKWEEEIRKSLAAKKASTQVTLTKQQQALVNAQLEREAKIRHQVAGIRANLERGLQFIRSLVAYGVDEFRDYISAVASLILEGALGRGSMLVGRDAFDTYLVSLAVIRAFQSRDDTRAGTSEV
jgi:hypothetical protein